MLEYRRYAGWVWKSDTSSDESVGHFFAFTLAAQLAPTAAERRAAAETVAQMVDYLLDNGFELKDWTGYSTTWGRWSPRLVNHWRPFSDERGLQSLQMLSFLRAAHNVSTELPATPARAARRKRWAAAWADLTNATNAFDENMLNAKIASPVDDSYSDDELMFLPYYTYLTSEPSDHTRRATALASLERSWSSCSDGRGGRSDLWAVIYMAVTGTREADDLASLLWTLRNWPTSLIDWPTSNAQRLDTHYKNDGANLPLLKGAVLAGAKHPRTTRVLPTNERTQFLWNADPFDATGLPEVGTS